MVNIDMSFEKQKISVVMCTFNGEEYIEEQLDSILGQTVMPDEIIIKDDCSTDGTYSIVCEYVKRFPEIKFIVEQNQINCGFINNFMSAIRKASGDIIFLADQDDIWYKNKIEEMVKVFCIYKNSLAVSSKYNLIDSDGKIINCLFRNKKKYKKDCIKKISWLEYILSPRFPGMSMAIKSSLLEYIEQIDESLIPAHDWLLNEVAAYNEGMYFLKKELASYRQHGNNTIGIIDINKDNKQLLLKKRENNLNFLVDTHIMIKKMHKNDNNVCVISEKLLEIDKLRKENIYVKSLIRCTILYMMNYKYISVRCYLGDMYTILKCKFF